MEEYIKINYGDVYEIELRTDVLISNYLIYQWLLMRKKSINFSTGFGIIHATV